MTITFIDLLKLLGEKKKSEKTITVDDLVNLFSTALSGSCWCQVDNTTPVWEDKSLAGECFEEHMANILLANSTLRFNDAEGEDGPWELSLGMLDTGASKFLTDYDFLVRQVIKDGGFDYETADALFQCCLMGDVVYG